MSVENDIQDKLKLKKGLQAKYVEFEKLVLLLQIRKATGVIPFFA